MMCLRMIAFHFGAEDDWTIAQFCDAQDEDALPTPDRHNLEGGQKLHSGGIVLCSTPAIGAHCPGP